MEILIDLKKEVKFDIFWTTGAHDSEFSIIFHNLDHVPINLVSRHFALCLPVEKVIKQKVLFFT